MPFRKPMSVTNENRNLTYWAVVNNGTAGLHLQYVSSFSKLFLRRKIALQFWCYSFFLAKSWSIFNPLRPNVSPFSTLKKSGKVHFIQEYTLASPLIFSFGFLTCIFSSSRNNEWVTQTSLTKESQDRFVIRHVTLVFMFWSRVLAFAGNSLPQIKILFFQEVTMLWFSHCTKIYFSRVMTFQHAVDVHRHCWLYSICIHSLWNKLNNLLIIYVVVW